MSFKDTAGDKTTTARATSTPIARKYPVDPHEARDVATRRILHRESRRPKPNPTEWQIWLEFHSFPEVLGAYQAPFAAATKHWDRHFGEYWITQMEREDRRLYGEVRENTQSQINELLLRLGGEDPRGAQNTGPITLPVQIEVWRHCLHVARVVDDCDEDSKRVRFLRRGLARLEARLERGQDMPDLAEALADELVR